ncbi:hypothetical protein SAMN04515668_2965 [Hymenobacter arizonensis]|uniref:Uncharacterized protein n=1 Tax=Hymenobacter arizonensis TaxID=1227077 RepID=A0A1I5ZJE4_HYMAR|nr:hypothetical protein SAMN04515668_2965 [Hymenobacter arizonensis]
MLTKEASYHGCLRQKQYLPERRERDKMLRKLSMTYTI